MDITLDSHSAKHICKVPEGLRELSSDICREVIRSQPHDMHTFVADYLDALLITRENAKAAMKIVHNIVLGSESIAGILSQTGLVLEEIALAAPKIQKAFRVYLDAVDAIESDKCKADEVEDSSQKSILTILKEIGVPFQDATRAATVIQTAFRGHYEKMLRREEKGEIQWQRAVANTMDILRKAGVSQQEASDAATLIQSTYRGYYTRRNIMMKQEEEKAIDDVQPKDTIHAVAWLEMMYEDCGVTPEKAETAAVVIQHAFRSFRKRKDAPEIKLPSKDEYDSGLSGIAIADEIQRRIIEKIKSRENLPKKFGSRLEVIRSIEKFEEDFKKRRKLSLIDPEKYPSSENVGDISQRKNQPLTVENVMREVEKRMREENEEESGSEKEESGDETTIQKDSIEQESIDEDTVTEKVSMKQESIDDETVTETVVVTQEPIDEKSAAETVSVKQEPIDDETLAETVSVSQEPIVEETATETVSVKRELIEDETMTETVEEEPVEVETVTDAESAIPETVDDETVAEKDLVNQEPAKEEAN